MKRAIVFVLLLLSLSVFFSSLILGVYAQEAGFAQEVSFVNGYTNKVVSNVIVSSFLTPSSPQQIPPVLYWSSAPSHTSFTPPFSRSILPDDEFTFFLDDPATPGNDYATKVVASSWLLSSFYPPKIPVFPSASVQGLVKDKLDNVVGNADIKFSCQNNNGLSMISQSDAFGSFKHEAL
ncbi:MAG: hypothetical protein Q8Q69_02430, partial [Nitrosopumilaceae archaeon]|nr:hypothetical protein [Nitrosopumilaceae archaeon]